MRACVAIVAGAILAVSVAVLHGASALVPAGGPERVEIAFAHGSIPAVLTRPADQIGWALGGVREIAVTDVESSAELAALHDTLRYRWADVRTGDAPVPRVFLAALPPDLEEVPSVAERKRLFFKSVLPLVVMVNEVISAKRQRILEIRSLMDSGRQVSDRDRRWLETMCERYNVADEDLDALLLRVDIVPPSLALAQAAKESGWGTSRFAVTGNAIFGQRTWDGGGLVPAERVDGETHQVRAFGSLMDSVWSYVHNLNSHAAYDAFRRERAAGRAEQGGTVEGYRLAGTLENYAETGASYVDALRSIIRVNKLRVLDREPLQTEVPEIVV